MESTESILSLLNDAQTGGVQLRAHHEYRISEDASQLFLHAKDITLQGLSPDSTQRPSTGPSTIITFESRIQLDNPRYLLRLDNVRLRQWPSGADSPMVIGQSSWMVLRGRATIEAKMSIVGSGTRVYYVLPAPRGMYVPGGILRTCSAVAQEFQEIGVRSPCRGQDAYVVQFNSDGLDELDALPMPCPAGRYGNSDDIASQRRAVCSAVCDAGYYCEEGTSIPTACEPGTFNAALGATSVAACIPCPRGSFCKGSEPDYAGAPAHTQVTCGRLVQNPAG